MMKEGSKQAADARTSNMSEMMTPEQVAEYLQLTKDTVYRLIRRRQLAVVRIGRSYRVPRADLEDFLLAQSTRPEVREALFRRVQEIAKRNADADGDALLAELEQMDEERGRQGKSA
jgi:excisionase family DNA binding protein